ncbi:MAG: Smr protein/MutS2, partial [Acidobacteria bacterium]|nr:Smr protein/MutS2 [Acidobacteriota bacterium]
EPVPEHGNRPFSGLSGLIKQAGMGRKTDAIPQPESPSAPQPRSSRAPQPAQPPEPPPDDTRLFEDAMQEVHRISWRHTPAAATPPAAHTVPEDPLLEDERLFREAVGGAAAPPILDHPEYIEGWIGVAGRRFLPRLRSGTYSIQGMIDLHGLSRVEAREAVEQFIVRMSRERSCCVKIVHGRGINSPSDQAVLKEHLQRWLATRRMSRHVVAYASAPYTDGGVGAIYVLLRRSQE